MVLNSPNPTCFSRYLWSLSIACLLLPLLIGCGGGSSSTESFSVGLPKTLTFSELSENEVDLFCEDYRKAFDDYTFNSRYPLCTHDAQYGFIKIPSTYTVDECKSKESVCLDGGGYNSGDFTTISEGFRQYCKEIVTSAHQCDLTLGEFIKCNQDALDERVQALNELSCETGSCETYNRTIVILGTLPLSRSCMTVKEKCPELALNGYANEAERNERLDIIPLQCGHRPQ